MKLPRTPLAILFDMDGLLFDTEKLYGQAILEAAAEIGCHMTIDLFRSMVGSPWHVNRERLLALLGTTFPVDALYLAWYRHFDQLVETDLVLKAGATELMDVLDELKLPRAIATSSKHDVVRHHLAAHSLLERFDAIIAFGDYAASKPAPDPFLRAAERLGVHPRHCLALEDSPNGVRSAAAAGTMTIMVPDLVQPTIEIERLCTFVMPDLHAVRRLFLTTRVC